MNGKLRLKWLRAIATLCALTLTIGLIAASIWYGNIQQTQSRNAAFATLASVAQIKISRIVNWRDERLANLEFFSSSKLFSQAIISYIENPSKEAATLLLDSWKAMPYFKSIKLLDISGNVLLSNTADDDEYYTCPDVFNKGIKSGGVFIEDIHEARPGVLHMDLLSPVLRPGDNEPVAVINYAIDPRVSIFPIVQSWPIPTKTGEILLVRREGDRAVFLTSLRHLTTEPMGAHSLPKYQCAKFR